MNLTGANIVQHRPIHSSLMIRPAKIFQNEAFFWLDSVNVNSKLVQMTQLFEIIRCWFSFLLSNLPLPVQHKNKTSSQGKDQYCVDLNKINANNGIAVSAEKKSFNPNKSRSYNWKSNHNLDLEDCAALFTHWKKNMYSKSGCHLVKTYGHDKWL